MVTKDPDTGNNSDTENSTTPVCTITSTNGNQVTGTSGNDVICVDVDVNKIEALRGGAIPIYEPGLEEMVRRNRSEKRLTFTTTLARAIRQSQIVFIAVGTPTGEDGSADLQHVLAVAETIGRNMPAGGPEKIVITKSVRAQYASHG